MDRVALGSHAMRRGPVSSPFCQIKIRERLRGMERPIDGESFATAGSPAPPISRLRSRGSRASR